jgi:hypothetical protein
MSEQYTHTLIAKPKGFVPSAERVQDFLQSIVAAGVVPVPISIYGMKPTGKIRAFSNPFGGDPLTHEVRKRFEIPGIEEINNVTKDMAEYEIAISGFGLPHLPPLPIDFKDNYSVEVRCQVSLRIRSTSDAWYESDEIPKTAPYGSLCGEEESIGRFVDPHTSVNITVPDAGCSRFWIEFELGKFIFPVIENESLEMLNPTIVSTAEQIFGIEFVQGCHWG